MPFRLSNLLLLVLFFSTLSGCDLVEGIFKAGIWFTILFLVIIIVLIVLIFNSVGYQADKIPVQSEKKDF